MNLVSARSRRKEHREQVPKPRITGRGLSAPSHISPLMMLTLHKRNLVEVTSESRDFEKRGCAVHSIQMERK